MSSLDEVLRGETSDDATANAAADSGEANHTGETQQEAQPAGESQAAAPEAGNDAPPASEHDKLVPLKALEEERKGRQDWKEKAIRFEEELKHMRAQQSQPQAQQPQQPQQPLPPEMVMLNERFNISEMMAREKYADLDEKFEVFQKAAADNPALGAELARQKHPYDWMYKHAQKLQALAEIGDDPTAYEQKMREKIMAELQAAQPAEAQPAATPAAAPVLPKSLATNRSAAPRSAPVWTGPTPLDNILKR
jgi:hypothetical protein